MPEYDTAQICISGHVITSMAIAHPENTQDFCHKCGAPTITNCQECSAPIRGYDHDSSVISFSPFPVPGYCRSCGHAYPWIQAALEAAQELVDEQDSLSDEEKELLKKSLDDIVRDNPRSTVAAKRFKRLAAKGGAEAVEAFKTILIDVLSEGVKKIIWS